MSSAEQRETASITSSSTSSKMSFGTRPLRPISGDRIASVSDNPFCKQAGRQSPRTKRAELPAFLRASRNSFDTDDVRDYKPGVGNVHKLSGKFASLGGEDQSGSAFPKLKHASSVDNILNERDAGSGEASRQADRARPWASSLSHRAGSVESLSPRKSPRGSAFPVFLRHVQRQWEPVSPPQKSPRDARVEAPDAKLAREDIILIEKPPQPSPPSENEKDMEEEKSAGADDPSLKSEMDFVQLPKRNSVSAVRGLFEQATPRSFVSASAAQNTETNEDDEAPAAVSSVSEDSVTCPDATAQLDWNTYPGTEDDQFQPARIIDIHVSAEDPSSSDVQPSLPMDSEISGDREESKSWLMLDVKTANCDSDNSSWSSSPPPLPLSPPPLLPLSPPPGSSAVAATVYDDVLDIQSEVSSVQVDVSSVQVDVSDAVRPWLPLTGSSKRDSSIHPPVPSASSSSGLPQKSVPPQSEPPLSVPPLPPIPPPLPPQPTSPHYVAAIKATPVYHPIPFRCGAGIVRSGAVVPPSFTPSLKKSSPVAAVAPFRQSRAAEGGSAERRFNFQRFSKVNFMPKRGRDPSKDYCEVIVESGGNLTKKETEERKEPEPMSNTETETNESKEAITIQKVTEKVKAASKSILQEETDRRKDQGVNVQKETPETKEQFKKIPQNQSDEAEDTEPDSSTETQTAAESRQPQTKVSTSDAESELWKPSIHSSAPDSVENLWKFALKPVSRHLEDSQPKMLPVEPVPITVASSAPAFSSSSQEPSQSEHSLQLEEKTETTRPALLSKSAKTEKVEEVRMKSKDSVSLAEVVSEEETQMKSRQSLDHPETQQDEVHIMKSKESVVIAVNLPETRKQEVLVTNSKGSSTSTSSSSTLSSTGLAGWEKMDETEVEEKSSEAARDTSQAESSQSVEEPSKPIRGIPTIIANRLKQQNSQKQNGDASPSRSPGELFGVRLNRTQPRHEPNSVDDRDGTSSPLKRLTPTTTTDTFPADSSSSSAEVVNQFASVLKRKDHSNRGRSGGGVSQIFDSSQLHKKRKEKKAAKTAGPGGASQVDGRVGSSPGTGRVSRCNIEFIGANVSTGRSLLGKNRKVKIRVHFHEVPAKTFEYPSEEQVLQDYIQSHPNEVVVLEEVMTSSWPSESSSDAVVDVRGLLRKAGGVEEGEGSSGSGGMDALDKYLLKSNTSLAHSGSLQSYRSKYQQDYQLGSVLDLPDGEAEPHKDGAKDPGAMQVQPAEEEVHTTYSVETSSDLLF